MDVFGAVLIAIIVYLASLGIIHAIVKAAIREGVYAALEKIITGTTEKTAVKELVRQGVAEGIAKAMEAALKPPPEKKK